MPEGPPAAVPELLEHLFRHQAGRMLAGLTRLLGLDQLDLAEEAVQEALLKALRQWPFRGVPDDPAAWLMRVARNQAVDLLRRDAAFRRKVPELEARLRDRAAGADPACQAEDRSALDDTLAMMFACCHPALPAEARVALTLKAVGGFSVAEIARAFFAEETAVAQRLVRAKRRIQDEGIALALPAAEELPARLDSVLQVIYLVFNEGYTAHRGEKLVRDDLCGEAIRLGSLLAARAETALPKVHALLALMYLQASRLPARVDAGGELLLLAEQDRSLWDQTLLHAGLCHLGQAAEGDELTEYHLQAGIAAAHATAPSYEATDWPHLLALYDGLLALAPSPVVALNRTVALAMVRGPQAGLDALEAVRDDPALRRYYLLRAVQADLLRRLGREAEAAEEYRAALALPCSEPERRFLLQRLVESRSSPPDEPPPLR
jgi:RNA polymerase sigma-70 factor (ECF subfamily)